MASKGQENDIKCIFFSEFHYTAGPKIIFQEPDDYITKDVFDSLSVYIIPKPQLQKKVITINALGHKLIGYPVSIDNPLYKRNELIFNLCFVCNAWARTVQYEPVVKKITRYFTTLELEFQFLSEENNKEHIKQIIRKILHDLNKVGHCTIPINESNTMHLRVAKNYTDPPSVEDHYVPLFVTPSISCLSSHWDLTTQQILPYINGFNHVAKIAAEADVEISLVKACIQNMVYYGVIILTSIFQYSNVYTVTGLIRSLAKDKKMQEECIKYVAKNERHPPNFRDIFVLYCALAPGITVRDVCSRHNPNALRVDERKLIQFGVMKGLIRRLHKFPILLSGQSQHDDSRPYKMFMSGNHSYDEICCKTGLNYQELEERVEKDPRNVICWK